MTDAAPPFDAATQRVVDAFDAQAKLRAVELLQTSSVSTDPAIAASLRNIRESAFCLGYKAGVFDLGQEHRRITGMLDLLFEAADAWARSPQVPDAVAGEVPDEARDRLLGVVAALREVRR